jgi:TRAP-type C4-dicarboxylate transport system substrate-binding protein
MKKLAVALAIGLLGSSAMAQDKPVDLKISIWVPPAHPLVPATKEWAPTSKASGGTIKTAIFRPNGSARRSTITTWRATASPT